MARDSFGRLCGSNPEWADMLARAGKDYDRLYIGYVSRFARNAEALFRAVRLMRDAGADLYFCDERLITSDPMHWDICRAPASRISLTARKRASAFLANRLTYPMYSRS